MSGGIDYPALAREIVRQQAALEAPVLLRDAAMVFVGKRSDSAFDRFVGLYYAGKPTREGYSRRLLEMARNKEAKVLERKQRGAA